MSLGALMKRILEDVDSFTIRSIVNSNQKPFTFIKAYSLPENTTISEEKNFISFLNIIYEGKVVVDSTRNVDITVTIN